MIHIQLSKSEQFHIAKILLIFTTGERFPRARLQPPYHGKWYADVVRKGRS